MKGIGLLGIGLLFAAGCGGPGPVTVEPPPADSAESARFLTNSIGMKLAAIPAGEFRMGSPDSAADAPEDEKPQHRVRITKPFYMGVYEVTQGEYQRVMGTNPGFFTATGHGKNKVTGLNTARFPVEQIRWPDAVEFCRRLSELPAEQAAGRRYRLPTEAEWEYACRAGTTTAFHFGDSLSSAQANFNGNQPYGGAAKGPFLVRTSEVGSYPANAFGLHDMHGNVWEWCADWFDDHYYRVSPEVNPTGPAQGTRRALRGGGWFYGAQICRSAYRYRYEPDNRHNDFGLRVALDAR